MKYIIFIIKKDINMTSIEYSEESLNTLKRKRMNAKDMYISATLSDKRARMNVEDMCIAILSDKRKRMNTEDMCISATLSDDRKRMNAEDMYIYAILSDDRKAVKCLIDNGRKIYTSSVKCAIYKSNFEIVELLKKNEHQHAYSKDINVFPGLFNIELISIPLFHENIEMVTYLIKMGCVMNSQSLEGAIRSKNLTMVLLIINFLDTVLFDRIFEIIVEFGNVEILNYFLTTTKISIPKIFSSIVRICTVFIPTSIVRLHTLSSDKFEELQVINRVERTYINPIENNVRCMMSEWCAFTTPLWYKHKDDLY